MPDRSRSASGAFNNYNMQVVHLKRYFCRARAALLALLAAFSLGTLIHAPVALSQTLDEIETLTERDDLVIRIKFNARVQYLRHAPVGTADLVQIYFQVLAADDASAVQTAQESRSSPPHGPFP